MPKYEVETPKGKYEVETDVTDERVVLSAVADSLAKLGTGVHQQGPGSQVVKGDNYTASLESSMKPSEKAIATATAEVAIAKKDAAQPTIEFFKQALEESQAGRTERTERAYKKGILPGLLQTVKNVPGSLAGVFGGAGVLPYTEINRARDYDRSRETKAAAQGKSQGEVLLRDLAEQLSDYLPTAGEAKKSYAEGTGLKGYGENVLARAKSDPLTLLGDIASVAGIKAGAVKGMGAVSRKLPQFPERFPVTDGGLSPIEPPTRTQRIASAVTGEPLPNQPRPRHEFPLPEDAANAREFGRSKQPTPGGVRGPSGATVKPGSITEEMLSNAETMYKSEDGSEGHLIFENIRRHAESYGIELPDTQSQIGFHRKMQELVLRDPQVFETIEEKFTSGQYIRLKKTRNLSPEERVTGGFVLQRLGREMQRISRKGYLTETDRIAFEGLSKQWENTAVTLMGAASELGKNLNLQKALFGNPTDITAVMAKTRALTGAELTPIGRQNLIRVVNKLKKTKEALDIQMEAEAGRVAPMQAFVMKQIDSLLKEQKRYETYQRKAEARLQELYEEADRLKKTVLYSTIGPPPEFFEGLPDNLRDGIKKAETARVEAKTRSEKLSAQIKVRMAEAAKEYIEKEQENAPPVTTTEVQQAKERIEKEKTELKKARKELSVLQGVETRYRNRKNKTKEEISALREARKARSEAAKVVDQAERELLAGMSREERRAYRREKGLAKAESEGWGDEYKEKIVSQDADRAVRSITRLATRADRLGALADKRRIAQMADVHLKGFGAPKEAKVKEPFGDLFLAEAHRATMKLDAFARVLKAKYGEDIPDAFFRDVFDEAAKSIYDKDYVQLKAELGEKVAEEYARTRPAWQQVIRHTIKEPLDFTRAFMSSGDVSAIARQGAILGSASLTRKWEKVGDKPFAYAPTWALAAAKGIKAAAISFQPGGAEKSRAYVHSVEQQIYADMHKLYGARMIEENIDNFYTDVMGIDFSPSEIAYHEGIRPLLTKEGDLRELTRDIEYRSKWAAAIPGISQIIGSSERSFSTTLNYLRAKSADALYQPHRGMTDADAKAIGNYVNIAAGRGIPNQMNAGAMTAASIWLFSPKFTLSRAQYALYSLTFGGLGYGGTLRARKAIMIDHARTVGALGAFYAGAHAAGLEINTDPSSSGFGTVKLPSGAFIDALAGTRQMYTMMAWLNYSERKSYTGADARERPITEDLMNLYRSKASPFGQVLLNTDPKLEPEKWKDFRKQPWAPQGDVDRLQEFLARANIQPADKAMRAAVGLTNIAGSQFGPIGFHQLFTETMKAVKDERLSPEEAGWILAHADLVALGLGVQTIEPYQSKKKTVNPLKLDTFDTGGFGTGGFAQEKF